MAFFFLDYALPMLRVIINDMGSDPTYSDNRLEEILLVSAQFVVNDISSDTYTVSIPELSIDPDPVTESDNVFLNLTVIRAACFADMALLRTKLGSNNVRAQLGPASIAVGDNVKGYFDLVNNGSSPCKIYEQMLKDYIWGNVNVIKAILTPFSNSNFNPSLGVSYRGESGGRAGNF